MAPERTRVLHRNEAAHPVMDLLDAADANQPAEPPAPAPRRPPVAAVPPAPEPAPNPERGKKQVNYRLDPGLIEELKKASIDFSFRQGQQYSQNRIVELAIREWLDANGPWEH